MASIYFKTLMEESCIKNRIEWAEKVFKNMNFFIQFNFSQINSGLCFSLTVLHFYLKQYWKYLCSIDIGLCLCEIDENFLKCGNLYQIKYD